MSGSDPGDSAKTCFVAMPITTSTAYAEKLGDQEHFEHVLTHLFTPALKAAGLDVIPPSVAGSELIHAEVIRNLEQADFVLCDLSDLNPNVLFELGVRTSLDRPVILVRDDLTGKIPFDINAVNTATYDSSLTPWSLAAEIPRLTSFFQGVVGNGNSGNAMWRYFGLTKRGAPSEAGPNPIEAKLDLVLRELQKASNLPDALSGQSSALTEASFDLRQRRMLNFIGSMLEGYEIKGFGFLEVTLHSTGGMVVIGVPEDRMPTLEMTHYMQRELRRSGFGEVIFQFRKIAQI